MAVMLFLIGRFSWIQIISNKLYQEKALGQRLRELKVEPKRGMIYDKNGVELAVSASADTVVAIPKEIKKPEETARKLSEILEKDQEEIYKRITKNAAAVYVSRKIDDKQAKAIRELNLPGITFTEETKRFYPKGMLASHLLGFSGVDNQGLQGLELSYDNQLKGNPGRISIESDAVGRKIPEGIKDYKAPDDGNNIYLTIDNVLQYIAERELDKALTEHTAEAATIVMMDPNTGEILALANRPAYDPNNFAEYSPGLWRNRAVSDTYEPGSTFKIITTSAGLEEGVVHPNDKFFDPGHIEVAGQIIHCWKSGGHGSQTFAEVVQNSCNPGFVQIGQRLGKETFYKYIEAFGFGDKTDIQFPGEAKGLMYTLPQIGPVELATIAFGHGVSVTPIQLITAVSAVANGGQLLKPHLVKEIRSTNGKLIKKIEPEPIRKVISEETAKTVRELLVGVVENGSGQATKLDGYEIGGKTGTAKYYGQRKYNVSFIGMLPADKPELVALVVVYGLTSEPHYASQVAVPIFHNVIKDAVRYLEIPPKEEKKEEEDEKERIKRVKVPNVKNLSLSIAEELLAKEGLKVKLEGEGDIIIDQVPNPEVVVNEGSTVILFFNGAEKNKNRYKVTVPDLKGMRIREAANIMSDLGLRLKWQGSGEITKQQPVAGKTVNSGDYITVWLK
jgi:stage V sporulation protein D (sporulation-specific penicillin-binding protein)